MVILRKLAFRVQSNLGAHPSKIKNAASLLETTFESFNFHSDMWVRNEVHAQPWLSASWRLTRSKSLMSHGFHNRATTKSRIPITAMFQHSTERTKLKPVAAAIR